MFDTAQETYAQADHVNAEAGNAGKHGMRAMGFADSTTINNLKSMYVKGRMSLRSIYDEKRRERFEDVWRVLRRQFDEFSANLFNGVMFCPDGKRAYVHCENGKLYKLHASPEDLETLLKAAHADGHRPKDNVVTLNFIERISDLFGFGRIDSKPALVHE